MFSWHDQLRLAEVARELERRGAFVIVTNADDPRVARLYRGVTTVRTTRRVQLPKAFGTTVSEAIFLLGDRTAVRAASRALGEW
jgi:hypothetical protein